MKKAPAERPPGPPKAPTKELLTRFDDLHKATTGYKAVFSGAKDATQMARVWTSHGELVYDLMVDFFESEDPFIVDNGYSVGLFVSQAPKLLAHRARRDREATSRRQNVWDKALERIETKVTRHLFFSWFKKEEFVRDLMTDREHPRNVVQVSVRDALVGDWIRRHHQSDVDAAFVEVGRPGCVIEFLTSEDPPL